VVFFAFHFISMASWAIRRTKKKHDCSEDAHERKSKKYHTVGTIPKSKIKIVERGKINISNTQKHDRSLS
jgi:hypothetical protein